MNRRLPRHLRRYNIEVTYYYDDEYHTKALTYREWREEKPVIRRYYQLQQAAKNHKSELKYWNDRIRAVFRNKYNVPSSAKIVNFKYVRVV